MRSILLSLVRYQVLKHFPVHQMTLTDGCSLRCSRSGDSLPFTMGWILGFPDSHDSTTSNSGLPECVMSTGCISGPSALFKSNAIFSSSVISSLLTSPTWRLFSARISGNVMGGYFFWGPCRTVEPVQLAKYAMLCRSPCIITIVT